jgi:hypothetical protein
MAQQLLDSAAQTQNLAHDLIFAIRDFRDTLAHHLEFLSKSDLRPEKTWVLQRIVAGLDAVLDGMICSFLFHRNTP